MYILNYITMCVNSIYILKVTTIEQYINIAPKRNTGGFRGVFLNLGSPPLKYITIFVNSIYILNVTNT